MIITSLDLFAGAGGLSLGFQAAGFRTIGAVEIDGVAAETFARTFETDEPVVFGGPDHGDVNQLDVRHLLDALPTLPDVVIGGPPCQGFSRIGRAKHASLLGEDERIRSGGIRDVSRNLLYQYFLDVVREAKPRAFLMENVPGMRELIGNDFARRIARESHGLGYNVRYFLLNAAHYGVPQNRWRIFFMGIRADLGVQAVPRPPVRTHSSEMEWEFSHLPDDAWFLSGPDIPSVPNASPAVTVREAIGDLPKQSGHLAGGRPREQRLSSRKAPSAYVKMLRAWPKHEASQPTSGSWYRHVGKFTGRQDHRIFELMAQGDRYPDALYIGHRLFSQHIASMTDRPEPGSPTWEDLRAKFVPRYRNDAFDDKWRKLVADEPSWTVTAHLSKDSYSHIHYDSRQARTISIREAARLQSFPDGIDFSGNFGDQFRQIGNAVPPVLAWAIAASLSEQLAGLGSPTGRAEPTTVATGRD